MTPEEARASGYAAYYDAYSYTCMDGILPEPILEQWKIGYAQARKEVRGK